MKDTFLNLILEGVLVRDDLSETLEDTGFISYGVKDGLMLTTKAQHDENTEAVVEYVQHIAEETDAPECWVVQLAGFRDNPNNYKVDPDLKIEWRLYKEL